MVMSDERADCGWKEGRLKGALPPPGSFSLRVQEAEMSSVTVSLVRLWVTDWVTKPEIHMNSSCVLMFCHSDRDIKEEGSFAQTYRQMEENVPRMDLLSPGWTYCLSAASLRTVASHEQIAWLTVVSIYAFVSPEEGVDVGREQDDGDAGSHLQVSWSHYSVRM